MDVRFAVPEFASLDTLKCEALAMTYFSDERPLRGALGLVDWRMCGHISRMILAGRLTGDLGETVLLPGRPHMAVDKLFLFGLGPQSDCDTARVNGATLHMLQGLAHGGVRSAALVLPGRSTGHANAVDAMEGFVRAWNGDSSPDEFVILEPAEEQRAMQAIVDQERRRARAPV